MTDEEAEIVAHGIVKTLSRQGVPVIDVVTADGQITITWCIIDHTEITGSYAMSYDTANAADFKTAYDAWLAAQ